VKGPDFETAEHNLWSATTTVQRQRTTWGAQHVPRRKHTFSSLQKPI